MLSHQLGALIRERRMLRQLTQDELARLAGVSQGAVSRLENPRGSSSRMDVIDRVLRALGVRVEIAVGVGSQSASTRAGLPLH